MYGAVVYCWQGCVGTAAAGMLTFTKNMIRSIIHTRVWYCSCDADMDAMAQLCGCGGDMRQASVIMKTMIQFCTVTENSRKQAILIMQNCNAAFRRDERHA